MANSGWTSNMIFSFIFSAAYATSWLNCLSERTLLALDKTSRHISLKTRSAPPNFASSINSLQALRICSLIWTSPCNQITKLYQTPMLNLVFFMTASESTNPADIVRKHAAEQRQLLRYRMDKIKHKIAVISGKGGVGKSTVTVNLAAAFALHGHHVGILDADIHGPSVPRLLGLTGQQVRVGPPGAFPVTGPLGMKVVSIDFFLPVERVPTILRGPLKMTAIRAFLSDVVWGELDVLFIDLPPGTGDEPLSVAQLL